MALGGKWDSGRSSRKRSTATIEPTTEVSYSKTPPLPMSSKCLGAGHLLGDRAADVAVAVERLGEPAVLLAGEELLVLLGARRRLSGFAGHQERKTRLPAMQEARATDDARDRRRAAAVLLAVVGVSSLPDPLLGSRRDLLRRRLDLHRRRQGWDLKTLFFPTVGHLIVLPLVTVQVAAGGLRRRQRAAVPPRGALLRAAQRGARLPAGEAPGRPLARPGAGRADAVPRRGLGDDHVAVRAQRPDVDLRRPGHAALPRPRRPARRHRRRPAACRFAGELQPRCRLRRDRGLGAAAATAPRAFIGLGLPRPRGPLWRSG